MKGESESHESDPETLLNEYLGAFAAMDEQGTSQCFAEHGVVELPVIKSSRLIGLSEIGRGHELAFENLTQVEIALNETLSDENTVMASGEISVTCRGEPVSYEFGVAAICGDQRLDRLSWYLDSRGKRLWSDRSVL